MAANYIGTGLACVTCGLHTGVDLPALGAVLTTDTLASEAGTWDATDVTAANLLVGATAGVGGVIVGTLVEETHTADQVLKSAGGNYDDDNLTAANVKATIAFGLGLTGEYNPMAVAVFPSMDQVLNAVNYGPTGADYTGDVVLPATTEVQDGVMFGPSGLSEGEYNPMAAAVWPAVGNVLTVETAWGPTGAEYAGTFNEAARNTDPGVGNVLASAGNYLIAGVTKTPTLVPDYPDAGNTRDTDTTNGVTGTLSSDKVLKSNATGSGAGNYNDDNLSVGNVRPVAFGLAQTGTLANLAATDAAYLALEATRNNANGTTGAQILVGYAPRIRNVTLTGTAVAGDPPDAPDLAVVATETGFTATLSGETAGSTNTLYHSLQGAAFVSAGSTWTGGKISAALSESGVYWFVVVSLLDGMTQVSDVVRISFAVASPAEADDNVAIAKKTMKQTAVYWPPETEFDEHGAPVSQEPVEIGCRWDEDLKEFIGLDGTTQVSKAQAIVDRDVERGGVLMLGTLDDVSDPDDPKANDGAQEILAFQKNPNLRGTKYVRVAFL